MELRRREFAALMLGGAAALSLAGQADAESDPLPSWNAGPAKDAIVKFVHATTDAASPDFVPLADRIATFDQDGTLWVEHPIYTQLVYCLDRVPALVKAKPELAKVEPFRTVLTGDREAIARLGLEQLIKIAAATLTGMDVDTFRDEVAKWIAEARDPRWKRPYTDLVYAPQIELLKYLRSVGYRTYIVTGGGQGFVRVYSERVYGIPPEQVVGTAGATQLSIRRERPGPHQGAEAPAQRRQRGQARGHQSRDRPPTLFRFRQFDRRPPDARIYKGRRRRPPRACWCCTTTASVNTPTGPRRACPKRKSADFHPELYDEATKDGWIVVSMKNDWKRIFAFE